MSLGRGDNNADLATGVEIKLTDAHQLPGVKNKERIGENDLVSDGNRSGSFPRPKLITHTLIINPQPGLRKQIESILAPFLHGWDRCIREYNKKFNTNVRKKAQTRKCDPVDIIGEDGRYQDFLEIANKHYGG